MSHDLFSSLDSFAAVSVAATALLVRDVTGEYRPADADEVLAAAQRVLADQVQGFDVLSSPAVGKDFLRVRLRHFFTRFPGSFMWTHSIA